MELFPLLNFGDDPHDNRAVVFGIRLYEKYAQGRSLTFFAFQLELEQSISGFERREPYPWSVPGNIARDWPYPVGYFNAR